jgi:hypothetical protein
MIVAMWRRVRRLPRRSMVALLNRIDARFADRLGRGVPPRVATRDDRRRALGALAVRVYWIERPGEVGPATSVYWGHQELLRIDLFDEQAHLHYGFAPQLRRPGGGGARIFVDVDTDDDRAARAAWEVRHNLAWCIATHPSKRVRSLHLDPTELDEVADWVRDQVLDVARSNR